LWHFPTNLKLESRNQKLEIEKTDCQEGFYSPVSLIATNTKSLGAADGGVTPGLEMVAGLGGF
jgi:hypothetical protein